MMLPKTTSHDSACTETFTFGDFQLHTRPLSLSDHEGPVILQPQPARLLALLVERHGEIVARQEIREELWPQDAYLDHEQAINFAICKIRTALNDRGETPRYVETIPRVGYRFVAELTWPSAEPSQEGLAETSALEVADTDRSPPPRSVDGFFVSFSTRAKLSAVLLAFLLLVPAGGAPEFHRDAPAAGFLATARHPGGQGLALDVAVTPGGEASRTSADQLKGHAATDYRQGRFLVEQESAEDVRLGIARLRRVLVDHPDLAPAHHAIAQGFFNLGKVSHHFSSYMPEIHEKVTRALELDPDHPQAHWLLSLVLFYFQHDWQAAESAARRSLALDTSSPDALQILGMIRAAKGDTDHAVALMYKALALDPAEPMAHSGLAFCLMYDRQYAEALKVIAANLSVAPSSRVNLFLDASLRYRLGDFAASLSSFQDYLETWGKPRPTSFDEVFENLFDIVEERRLQGRRSHLPLALFHALRGDDQEALALLFEACDHDPDWELPLLGVDPRFDAVRELPGFARLEPCVPSIGSQSPEFVTVDRDQTPAVDRGSPGGAASQGGLFSGTAGHRRFQRK